MDAIAPNDDDSGDSDQQDEEVKEAKAESSCRFMGVENKHESEKENSPSSSSATDGRSSPAFECTVCLQTASFPVQLPCKHIFCFLCVKGVAQRSHRCALCRQEIPADFLNDPKVVLHGDLKDKAGTTYDEGYQWFYEGRNGWWQYDDRTSLELEARYKKGDKVFEQLIAGFLYVIDLENMKQCRKYDQSRRRRMRRDLRNIPDVKGIAGLKFSDSQSVRPSGDGGETSNQTNNNNIMTRSLPVVAAHTMRLPQRSVSIVDDTSLAPPAPNNTPQTPQTPADSPSSSRSGSLHDLSSHLQIMHLNENMPSHYLQGPIPVRAEYTESDDDGPEAYIEHRVPRLDPDVCLDDEPQPLAQSCDDDLDAYTEHGLSRLEPDICLDDEPQPLAQSCDDDLDAYTEHGLSRLEPDICLDDEPQPLAQSCDDDLDAYTEHGLSRLEPDICLDDEPQPLDQSDDEA